MTDAQGFLARLLAELNKIGVDVTGYVADHLCYRVASVAEYAREKEAWSRQGTLLHEALISGRPIATFELAEPILYQERAIHLVELPSPKPASPYRTGWEHAEFVVPEGLTALMEKYRHLPWDTTALNKKINPEIRLAFGEISAKFHPLPLDEVIRIELAKASS